MQSPVSLSKKANQSGLSHPLCTFTKFPSPSETPAVIITPLRAPAELYLPMLAIYPASVSARTLGSPLLNPNSSIAFSAALYPTKSITDRSFSPTKSTTGFNPGYSLTMLPCAEPVTTNTLHINIAKTTVTNFLFIIFFFHLLLF